VPLASLFLFINKKSFCGVFGLRLLETAKKLTAKKPKTFNPVGSRQ
jgi:hypothetical protein